MHRESPAKWSPGVTLGRRATVDPLSTCWRHVPPTPRPLGWADQPSPPAHGVEGDDVDRPERRALLVLAVLLPPAPPAPPRRHGAARRRHRRRARDPHPPELGPVVVVVVDEERGPAGGARCRPGAGGWSVRLGLWSTALTMWPSTTAKQIGTRCTVPSAPAVASRPTGRDGQRRRHPRRRVESPGHENAAITAAKRSTRRRRRRGRAGSRWPPPRPPRRARGTGRSARPRCRRRPTPGTPRAWCPSAGSRAASASSSLGRAPDEGGRQVGHVHGGRIAVERCGSARRARRACGPPPAGSPRRLQASA